MFGTRLPLEVLRHIQKYYRNLDCDQSSIYYSLITFTCIFSFILPKWLSQSLINTIARLATIPYEIILQSPVVCVNSSVVYDGKV